MKITTVLQRTLFGCLFVAFSLQSCKDEDIFVETKAEIGPEEGGNRTQQTLDSIFLYAKETYLWYDALPSYQVFDPRKYDVSSNDLEDFEKELYDISQFKINSATGNPYEYKADNPYFPKYSYLEEDEAFSSGTGARIAMMSSGTETDFGFGLASVSATDVRVRYVYPGSPAGNKSLSRGDRLVKVNDRLVRVDKQSEVDYINNAMSQPTIKIEVEKKDGSLETLNLSQTTYTVQPVFKKIVTNAGSAKVGYLVFDTFTRQTNAQAALDEAFNEFASSGVTDLIIDLRYNGGGYVHTAEYLCNLIAPSSLNGSVMYKEQYNDLMQRGEATILENQVLLDANDQPKKFGSRNATYADLDYTEAGCTYNFAEIGALNSVKNVVFIISSGTASASELVINALKPYMNVTLVGEQSYGKPVGFFGITIDKYKMYIPNFKTINSRGEGEYFDGFTPDVRAGDDVRYDFGDPQEASFAAALSVIENGGVPNARIASSGAGQRRAASLEVKHLRADNRFKGMVEERLNLK